VVQNFAVDTKFTISGGVGPLVLRQPVVGVASVVALSPGAISAVVIPRLLRTELLLLLLLWPESSHIGIRGCCIVILVILHSMDIDGGGLAFILFNPMFSEEHLVGVIDGEPSLVFVGQ